MKRAHTKMTGYGIFDADGNRFIMVDSNLIDDYKCQYVSITLMKININL